MDLQILVTCTWRPKRGPPKNLTKPQPSHPKKSPKSPHLPPLELTSKASKKSELSIFQPVVNQPSRKNGHREASIPVNPIEPEKPGKSIDNYPPLPPRSKSCHPR